MAWAHLALTVGLLLWAPGALGFRCIPVNSQSKFCAGSSPSRVCAVGEAVDGSVLTEARYTADKNSTCPKDPALFTPALFCQGPWLPCVEDADCAKKTHKRCWGLCMNGGLAAGRSFLGAAQCAKDMHASTYCNARVQAGEVAPPGEEHCIGLTDFQTNHARSTYGHSVFIPEVCRATLPIADITPQDLGDETQKEIVVALAEKINEIFGLDQNDDAHKFVRGDTLRNRRFQVTGGVVSLFLEAKQFCLAPLREGKWLWTKAFGKATNLYCDVPGPLPATVWQNLTDLLASKPEDEGMKVGDYWVRQEYHTHSPQMPTKCFSWEAEEEDAVPKEVWAVVSVGSCVLLLSLLILQHRWRNGINRVRANQKLRSFT